MMAFDLSAPEDDFDIEAGMPEVPERSAARAPAQRVAGSAPPGLAGVATISLASPPRESGVCRCGACLVLPVRIDWME